MIDPLGQHSKLYFVTGRLAEHALRSTVGELAKTLGFQYEIGVMPITVAALITPRWLARHLNVPHDCSDVILPGYVGDDLELVRQRTRARVIPGPHDLRDLPEFLGAKKPAPPSLDEHDIEVIAEINHAPRYTHDQLRRMADAWRADGADRIDVGCDPGQSWSGVGDAVAALVRDGHRVSIDSFDEAEVRRACDAGATLVLSVNSQNAALAARWGAEVVAIPDTPDDLASMDRTIEILRSDGVAFRLDPILEPIGSGLTASIIRYHQTRQRYPDAPMMMGIGNLTELTDVDSAGVNVILMGIGAELGIQSVLTTEVVNWARSAVRECDLARRLVHYAVTHRVPPKRLDDSLVMLRDPRLRPHPPGTFEQLAETIRDPNYRLYAQDGLLHLVSAGVYLKEADPFLLFARLLELPQSSNVDAAHAFYLGFELAKAATALQLGKQYDQDQPLRWGHLTQQESHHRLPRSGSKAVKRPPDRRPSE